jgi:ABC-type proline/glycine betaine transport system ATPase subunit
MKKASIFVTHDVREALRLGTRIALLASGSVDTEAAPSEFEQAQSKEARAFLACI